MKIFRSPFPWRRLTCKVLVCMGLDCKVVFDPVIEFLIASNLLEVNNAIFSKALVHNPGQPLLFIYKWEANSIIYVCCRALVVAASERGFIVAVDACTRVGTSVVLIPYLKTGLILDLPDLKAGLIYGLIESLVKWAVDA